MSAVDEVARTKINLHEKECSRRYLEVAAALGAISGSISKLYDRFWLAAVGLIAVLISLCGVLAAAVFRGQLF